MYGVGRPKKPAFLKKGRSEKAVDLKAREEQEKRLMGATDMVKEVPEYLDPWAQAYYKYIVAEMEISGLLTNLDIPLIEQTADALSKVNQCDEIINADGVLITTIDRNGREIEKEHPTIKTKMQYLKAYKALSLQLGMSPSSRAQLAGMQLKAKEEEDDPVLQILKGMSPI